MPDLAHNESYEVTGSSGTVYTLKNVGGAYSCTCPAWLNQHAQPHLRTCKHLIAFRGAAQEEERLGGAPAIVGNEGPTATKKKVPGLMLAHPWDNATDITGWWISEKLDGVRALWDGSRFISRQGNTFAAPDWFKQGLPLDALDGELWIGRKEFQRTISVVKRQDFNSEWRDVRYMVFDAPEHSGKFEERIRWVEELFARVVPPYAQAHPQSRYGSMVELAAKLDEVEALGGEGLMARQPGSGYSAGRSWSLLKIKRFHDAEARVVEHQEGTGKHMGRLGALLVELADGTRFAVGTGFTDAEREDPPAVGSLITFRYQELSTGGVPRFPSFVRLRTDDVELRMPEVVHPIAIQVSRPMPPRPPPPEPLRGVLRLEFTVGSAVRFWEVEVQGAVQLVRYGKEGQPPHQQEQHFEDEEEALRATWHLIGQKKEKGYVEVEL